LDRRSALPPAAVSFWLPAAVIFIVAALFRFIWVSDIEFKTDEQWTFEHVMAARAGEAWPWFGMPTSQNANNPGMSVWVFMALGCVTGVDTPTDLARVCQWTNVLAILGLLAFTRRCVPPETRALWLWAAALAAVNPVVVLLHRKIWPPSVCPLILVGVLVGYWHRDRRWGAALWGLGVMIVAQISLAGLFLAVGMAGWAALADRRGVRWRWWVLGSAVGGAPLVPWALTVYTDVIGRPTGQTKFGNILTLNYWVRWFTEPFGLSVKYSLEDDFDDFLRYPLIGEYPTYLMAIVHAALIGAAVYVVVGSLWRAWPNRARLGEWLTGTDRRTWVALCAVMGGFGLALTVTTLPIHRHYMLLTFPFMYVWLAAVALTDRRPGRFGGTRGQALLLVIVSLQVAATAGFLGYIHTNQRTIRGDYGTPYAAQVQLGLPPR